MNHNLDSILLLITAALALGGLGWWVTSGGPVRLLSSAKRLYRYLRLWRRLQDINWYAIAGRQDKEVSPTPPFKAFEAWIEDGWALHKAGDFDGAEHALKQALAMFLRLSDEQQTRLHIGAARVREEELRMMLADKCQ